MDALHILFYKHVCLFGIIFHKINIPNREIDKSFFEGIPLLSFYMSQFCSLLIDRSSDMTSSKGFIFQDELDQGLSTEEFANFETRELDWGVNSQLPILPKVV